MSGKWKISSASLAWC